MSKTSIMLINGKYYDFLNPDPSVLDPFVIAHALALTNRFAGHTMYPYSVAQHSYYVSLLCDPGDAREGALHDASEALINDIPRPAKGLLSSYKDMEERHTRIIYKRFGVPYPEGGMSPSVMRADMKMCLTEARDLMVDHDAWMDWSIDETPYDLFIMNWHWKIARELLLERFNELGIV